MRDFAGSGVNKTVALKPSAGKNKPGDKESKIELMKQFNRIVKSLIITGMALAATALMSTAPCESG